MGNLFTLLAIACMAVWLWGQLSGDSQRKIKTSAESAVDSAKDMIHKATQK